MKKLLFILTCLGVGGFSSHAELTITASADKPAAGKVLAAVGRETKENHWRLYYLSVGSDKGRRDLGQVFTVPGKEGSSVTVNALSLAVADVPVGVDALGAEVVLSFHDYSSGAVTSMPMVEESAYLPETFSPKDYLLFRFTPVKLEAGKRYAFVLSFQSPAPKRALDLEAAPERAYSEGTGLLYGWNPKAGRVLFYETEGNLVFTLYTAEE